MAAASTLATLLINQTLETISTLESLSVISPQDAALIRSKLNPSGPFPSLTVQSSTYGPPTLPPRISKPESRARALWDYNGAEVDDLRFRANDEIIVVDEVNEQWWRGKVVGSSYERIGLFPSNYFEKLNPDAASSPSQEKQAVAYASPPSNPYQHQTVPYQPQGQPYHGQHTQLYQQSPEKNRFGGLGAQMGTAVMHGAGFGVGSSIASHAVNAIL